MKRSSLYLLFVLAAVLTCAPPALAEDADAKTLFAEGRRLREEGKCAEAIDAFRRAFEAWPGGIGSLRNIAQCEEELGRYASARRSWWDLRREALKSNDTKYDDWEKDAEKEHARLDALVPRLTIQLRGAAPSQVRVMLNGDQLESNLVGVALERDVGEQRVEVWHDKDRLASERLLLDAGQREEIPRPAPRPLPRPKPKTGEPKQAESDDTLLITGIAVAGVGTLSFVGAIISGVVRGAAIDDLEAQCLAYPDCPPSMTDTLDRGQTATTLVNVLGIVGIVGITAGVGLIIAGVVTSEDGTTSDLKLEAVTAPGTAILRAELTF